MTASRQPAPRPTRQESFTPAAALERIGLRGDRLAFGLAGVGGAWGPVDQGVARETLRQAVEFGLGVFDVAPTYGTAETLLGEVLARWRGPRPVVSTKVGRIPCTKALEEAFDFSSVGMRESLQRSLGIHGQPAVDLLLLHEPEYVPPAERARVVDALRQLQADGLARRLGLASGHGPGWDGYVETGCFDVVMLFRRLDACIFDGLASDLPRVRRAGLATYGASPLHMGLLGSRHEEFVRDRPDWVWPEQIKRAIRLRALAAERGLPLPSLAHRFAFSAAEIDRVVIGARTPAELSTALADFAAGPLPAGLFDDVCSANLAR
jgi:aryl-alcohol dehydrogenase-like predicted oxidoreductase